MRILACATALFVVSGCASSKVATGAAIGAVTGGLAGAGFGYMITEESLLGSDANPETGDTSIPKEGILAAAAVGVAFGAIVGAMTGHSQEDGYEEPPEPDESAGGGSDDIDLSDDSDIDIDIDAELEAEAEASASPKLLPRAF